MTFNDLDALIHDIGGKAERLMDLFDRAARKSSSLSDTMEAEDAMRIAFAAGRLSASVEAMKEFVTRGGEQP